MNERTANGLNCSRMLDWKISASLSVTLLKRGSFFREIRKTFIERDSFLFIFTAYFVFF